MAWFYLVTSDRVLHYKIGIWAGSVRDLYSRYKTYFGKSGLEVIIHETNEARRIESTFIIEFKDYQLDSLEQFEKSASLYEKYCLWVKTNYNICGVVVNSSSINKFHKKSNTEVVDSTFKTIPKTVDQDIETISAHHHEQTQLPAIQINSAENQKNTADVLKPQNRHKCKLCGYETPWSTSMERHIKKKKKCSKLAEEHPLFQEMFSTYVLKKEVNKGEKKFICQKCTKELSCAPALSRHKRTCKGLPEINHSIKLLEERVQKLEVKTWTPPANH